MLSMDAMKVEVHATLGALRRLAKSGAAQRLAGMIRARAAISREGARRQVQTFHGSRR